MSTLFSIMTCRLCRTPRAANVLGIKNQEYECFACGVRMPYGTFCQRYLNLKPQPHRPAARAA